jgi:protoporphyrin/coproporphyrin ferrochelatase
MIGILLLNLGTPDAPTTQAVQRYLREFLSDPRVIDIPAIPRWLLVNCIIAPLRSRKSAAAYQKVWTSAGSPLLMHTRELAKSLTKKLGSDYSVAYGMRYGNPSTESAFGQLIDAGVDELRVIPLYPQYAESSTGSAIAEFERVFEKICRRGMIYHAHDEDAINGAPTITIPPPFYDHPEFIESLATVAKPMLRLLKPDHILMSFHGLPERHIKNADPTGTHCLIDQSCCDQKTDANAKCYRFHSYSTARALAEQLKKGMAAPCPYSVSFQSRLGRTPWIQPFTDHRIVELARQGVKRLAVICPSFVSDCLETLEEVNIRERERFLAAGGEAFELIPCLNAHPRWVEGLSKMIQSPPTPSHCLPEFVVKSHGLG